MNEIIQTIKDGGVVIMPTDTIYGIIADATNELAIKKVYELKKRDSKKPMLMLINGVDMLEKYTCCINDIERKLIDKFWPGPLTIIFKKKGISDLLTGGLDTIGVRFPKNELLIDIMNEINVPLLSTSVNISGESSVYDVNQLSDEIKKNVDFIYDNGVCKGEASSIVKIDEGNILVLREGSIKKEDICDVIKTD